MLVYDNMEAVRVKAKLMTEDGAVIKSTKFSLDPEITSFEMLQSLLAKAFDIKGELMIGYLAVDDEEKVVQLSLLNDWDLDAAILSSSRPYLKLVAQAKPRDDTLDEEWDVVTPVEIPAQRNEYIERKDTLLDSLTDRLGNMLGKKPKYDIYQPVKHPMSDAEFHNYMDSDGKLISVRAFRESVYQGGIEPSLRKVAWRHLLNVFPEDMTGKQRFEYLKKKSHEYEALKQQWKEDLKKGNVTEELRFVTSMVKKDVIRTDRTHSYYRGKEDNKRVLSLFDLLCTYALNHPDVSYCQGMSDMASVLLVVQADEANAYLCLCSLMRRLKHNFMYDGKAMECKFDHLKLLLRHYDQEFYSYLQKHEVDDLFFSYRWILLELKREFPFDDALFMLEVMWSTLPVDPPIMDLALSEVPAPSPISMSVKTPTGSSSGTSFGTPTPYAKLMALRRNSSQKMLSSLVTNSMQTISPSPLEEDSLDGSTDSEGTQLVTSISLNIADKAAEIDKSLLSPTDDEVETSAESALFSDHNIGHTQSEVTLSSCDAIPIRTRHQSETPRDSDRGSKFYLGLQYSSNGSPFYVYNERDREFETDAITQSAPTGSISSLDSGIRSRPVTPSKSSVVSAELQFAFESSGSHTCNHRPPIFPRPEDFGYGNPFLMFATATMILQHRDHIMHSRMDFDDIVTLFDKSVRKNDVNKILYRAKALYQDYLKIDQSHHDCSSSDFDLSVSI